MILPTVLRTDDLRARSDGWRTAARRRTVSESRLIDHLVAGGWAWEAAAGDAAGSRTAARSALDRFVGLGLPVVQTVEGRAFDPMEVINFSKWAGLADRDPFWKDRWAATGRRHVAAWSDAAVEPQGRRISVLLRRTFGLSGIDRSKPLRLRMPHPVQDEQLRDLRVDLVETGGLDCQVTADGTRLEARGRPPPETTELSLAVSLSFSTHAGSISHDGSDLRRYLQPREGFIQVTPRVATLAARLTERTRTPREKVARLWDFMLDRLISGVVSYDRLADAAAPTDWILANGWFDCQIGGALLAALCRAIGLPARLVGGYFLHLHGASHHYWTEVWLADEGWLPFDLSAWDLSHGGHDRSWRERLAGRLEPRLKCEILPLRFTGSPGVAVPAQWYTLQRQTAAGTETSVCEAATGRLIYRDALLVNILASGASRTL